MKTANTRDADEILRAVPDPDTVREWLSESITKAELLRRLLRLAERKKRTQAVPGGEA